MRNFIKNHTPEWWTGWCWFGLFMLAWSIFWALVRDGWTSGFHTGMAIYWVYWLIVQASSWYQRECLRIADECSDIKDQIILTQQAHINLLKGQLK